MTSRCGILRLVGPLLNPPKTGTQHIAAGTLRLLTASPASRVTASDNGPRLRFSSAAPSAGRVAMAKPGEPDLVALTKDLLDAIEDKNLPRYRELVDESITCFEPEAAGYLVEGIAFHEYYFQWDRRDGARVQTTLVRPHQRMLGPDAAVVSYVRLTQFDDADSGAPKTRYSEETRVWERKDGQWRNVHFHRSVPE